MKMFNQLLEKLAERKDEARATIRFTPTAQLAYMLAPAAVAVRIERLLDLDYLHDQSRLTAVTATPGHKRTFTVNGSSITLRIIHLVKLHCFLVSEIFDNGPSPKGGGTVVALASYQVVSAVSPAVRRRLRHYVQDEHAPAIVCFRELTVQCRLRRSRYLAHSGPAVLAGRAAMPIAARGWFVALFARAFQDTAVQRGGVSLRLEQFRDFLHRRIFTVRPKVTGYRQHLLAMRCESVDVPSRISRHQAQSQLVLEKMVAELEAISRNRLVGHQPIRRTRKFWGNVVSVSMANRVRLTSAELCVHIQVLERGVSDPYLDVLQGAPLIRRVRKCVHDVSGNGEGARGRALTVLLSKALSDGRSSPGNQEIRLEFGPGDDQVQIRCEERRYSRFAVSDTAIFSEEAEVATIRHLIAILNASVFKENSL